MMELLKFLQAAQAAEDQASLSKAVNQHAALLNAHSQALFDLQRQGFLLSAVCFGLVVTVLVLIAMNSRLRWRLKLLEGSPALSTTSSR